MYNAYKQIVMKERDHQSSKYCTNKIRDQSQAAVAIEHLKKSQTFFLSGPTVPALLSPVHSADHVLHLVVHPGLHHSAPLQLGPGQTSRAQNLTFELKVFLDYKMDKMREETQSF
jgi:hypothetical protein